jgi:hypothetical protein
MQPWMNYYAFHRQDRVAKRLPKHAPAVPNQAGIWASALQGWMRKGQPAHDANRT